MEVKDLTPKIVFHYFDEICKVPRPSKKEEKIRAFLIDFAKDKGLEYKVDEAGNVLIKKNATAGMENRKTVILQSHIDMVCEKNNDTVHDFDTDPIQTYIDGEWLKAKGTTLGADNGIGVATQLAVLASDDIQHGPLECLFTVDEETGLTGAFALKEGFMSGDILLNLDSEDEGELFIGCAGGAGTTAVFPCPMVKSPEGYFFFRVTVKGLTGGHSGDDINKNRANANKLLNRYLMSLSGKYDLYISEIDGGNLHNAIPREAHAVCAVPMKDKESVRVDLNVFLADVENEYSVTEPNISMDIESETAFPEVMDKAAMSRFLNSIHAVHNGVFAMSQELDWLVETSSNLASIRKEGDRIVVTTSQRSSIGSARENMSATVRAAFELGGARAVTNEGYPGWKMNPKSEILAIAKESYERLFHKEPKILAIHAGLECGLFSEKYPHLDMISVGPTLRGVHSPEERLLIPTVQMVWDHLLDILKHIPEAE